MNMPNSAIPGSQYLAFLSDPAYRSQSGEETVYADDVVLQVNGQCYEQAELMPETIGEDSEVIIIAGHVFQFMTPLHTLQAHFYSWREANYDHPAPR